MTDRDKRLPERADKLVRDIRRATRRKFSSEEKIRIVLEGLRGEETIAELCRKEGIAQNLCYRWSKDFLEAGKRLTRKTTFGSDNSTLFRKTICSLACSLIPKRLIQSSFIDQNIFHASPHCVETKRLRAQRSVYVQRRRTFRSALSLNCGLSTGGMMSVGFCLDLSQH
jgi:transposase